MRNLKVMGVLAACWLLAGGCGGSGEKSTGGDYEPRSGDIVFQTSTSDQSLAVQLATGSKFSHMGIVFVENGNARVAEAVGPVKTTPLAGWVARGQGGHFVAKRLKDAETVLTPESVQRLRQVFSEFQGRPYDPYFGWSPDSLYCSELVWKVYKNGLNLEIGRLQKVGDFDLTHPIVRALMATRRGGPPPATTTAVSPGAMFASDRLVTVHEE